jgi:cold shock CspA family protein
MAKGKLETGTLAKWSNITGYGFIAPDGWDVGEVFAHVEQFNDRNKVGEPSIGQRVMFNLMMDRKKYRATRISRVR